MKKKLLGIFVCLLLIAAAVLPVAGNIENSELEVDEVKDEGYGLGDYNGKWNQPVLDMLNNNHPVLSPEEYALIQKDANKEVSLDKGWYWKPPYPNYAPHTPGGMPDFDQRQNEWKSISDGGNRIAESNATMDDIQLIPWGDPVPPGDKIVAPGLNCRLDTTPAGDDEADWVFCSPVAVANCFWWFDSKYADPAGTPGDENDNFSLVEDYGAGDDHSRANVPLPICKLANAMKTCEKGTTPTSDMLAAIDAWFIDTGLDNFFEQKTYDKPTFNLIESEIKRSQDVILVLGYYVKSKLVDQEQPDHDDYYSLPTAWPGDVQEFTPNVNVSKLDAVQLLFNREGTGKTTVDVSIYDQLPEDSSVIPLGVSTTEIYPPALPETPVWYQFHFDKTIPLNPGEPYYIGVKSNVIYKIYWWWKEGNNSYPDGGAWRGDENGVLHNMTWAFDWTFKTEYCGDDCVRKSGHCVTCAGVNNSDEFKIAISDPGCDIQNPSVNDHNDAQNVSHDIYDVDTDLPCLNLDYNCWLPNYSADFAIVEKAVVICPIAEQGCCLQIDDMTGGLLEFSFPLLRVKAVIKNMGTSACNNVAWSFNFSGGFILRGANSCTISSIPPGGTAIVYSKIVLGLATFLLLPGSVTITADSPDNECPPATLTKDVLVIGSLLKVM